MAQAEQPERLRPQHQVTVDDVRQLMGASTPHFALQLRNRIRTLIAGLPEDDPARRLGEQEIARLERLGVTGEVRGEGFQDGQRPLPLADDPAERRSDAPARALRYAAASERSAAAMQPRGAAAAARRTRANDRRPAARRGASRRAARPACGGPSWPAPRASARAGSRARRCGRPPRAGRARPTPSGRSGRSARTSRGTTRSLPRGDDGRAPD